MKCFVHIGLQKCGSSALQTWLRKNRSALRARCILYPHTLGFRNHRFLTAIGLGYEPGHWAVQETGAKSADAFDHWKDECVQAFAAEVAALDADAKRAGVDAQVIISHEDLSRLPAPGASRCLDALRTVFDDITVFGYVRPPAELASSTLSQRARNGLKPDPQSFLVGYMAPLDAASNWASAAGQVRWRAIGQVGDVVTDLCDLIGEPPDDYQSAARANPSLSAEHFALLSDLAMPFRVKGQANANRQMYLGEMAGRAPFKINRELAQFIQARHAPTIARFLEFAPDLSPEDLEVDLTAYPLADQLESTAPPPYAADLRFVIARLNAQIWIERAIGYLHLAEKRVMERRFVRAGHATDRAEDALRKAAQVDSDIVQDTVEALRADLRRTRDAVNRQAENGPLAS